MKKLAMSRRQRSTSHMHQYEMFKTKKDDNINEMFTRFTLITKSLNSLGKNFTNAEKVQKVLRCLPRS